MLFVPYTKQNGFKFALDGLFNTPNSQLYGAILSLNPPGAVYDKDD